MTVTSGLIYKLKSIFGDAYEIPPKSMFSYDVHYFPFFMDNFICYDESFEGSSLNKNIEYYLGNQGWYVKRTPLYSFACRGGTNGESHNHNDVGSFIFCRDDKQVLCDIGGRPYTRQYFENEHRYTFLETSSRGHNVPIINGQYQANIRETRSYTKYENGVISIDFHELYDIKGLSLVRNYKPFEKGVYVTDEFAGVDTFTERFVSFEKPEISDGEILVGELRISFDSNLANADYIIEKNATRLNFDGSMAETRDVYCMNINVKNPKDSFSFTIEVI